MKYYYSRQTGNPITAPTRNVVVRDRIKRRKQEKKSAKEKYRGRNFEFKNGILYFAGTKERVPGSTIIRK